MAGRVQLSLEEVLYETMMKTLEDHGISPQSQDLEEESDEEQRYNSTYM